VNSNVMDLADCGVLATDLDGTLIPLDGEPQNQTDLQTLAIQLERNRVTLVFVTGRHFESASQAIQESQLPRPDWIICDVGTSIFQRQSSRGFTPVEPYQEHLDEIIAALPIDTLRKKLEPIEGLRLQEEEKQGRFKLSFYTEGEQVDERARVVREELDRTDAPYSIVSSVDPFNGDGLIDLLPSDVSKGHALAWWVEHAQLRRDGIVFAGDSGNDLAALTAGYRAIVVANADRSLAERVADAHGEAGWTDRLYLARGKATSGVLEGCRWFGLAASE
jgi:HAD superfamily hydrolase (TIGR01484 family)